MESECIENIRQLKPCLDDFGCIKAPNVAVSFVEKMSSINSVAGRSLLIYILKSTAIYSKRKTTVRDALAMFLECGGWVKLGLWFSEMIPAKNFILLTHLVETLTLIPVTIELLRESSIPKSLKTLVKLSDKLLQNASKRLLYTWKKFVKDINEKKLIKSGKSAKSAKPTTFLDSLSAAIETPEKQRKRKVTVSHESYKNNEEIIKNNPISEKLLESSNINNLITPLPFSSALTSSTNEILNISSENIKLIDTDMNEVTKDFQFNKKKRVSFREESLVEVFVFEMTDQERTEMHGEHPLLKFDEARQLEFQEEKQALKNAKKYSLEEGTEWLRSIEIDNIIITRGEKSQEKQIQAIRESNILPPIFIDKSQIPLSSFEPLQENVEDTELITLPELKCLEESQIPCIPYWENYSFNPQTLHRPSLQYTQILRRGESFRARYNQNFDGFQRGSGLRGRGKGRFYCGQSGKSSYPLNNFNADKICEDIFYADPFHQDKIIHQTQNYQKNPDTFIKTVKCRHFIKGTCKKGTACTFIHDNSDISR